MAKQKTYTLKDLRERLEWSQVELDRRAGLVKGTTHDLESGRTEKPSHDIVTRIVRVFRRAGFSQLTSEQVFPVSEERIAS